MNILFLDKVHLSLQEKLQTKGHQTKYYYTHNFEEIRSLEKFVDGFIIRSRMKITSKVIDLFPELKFIGRFGAGMENIDVVYAESKGIKCIHAPEGNKDAVGEHVLGMLLMLLNNLKKADNEVRNGIWKREENRGVEIQGKTFAIIGYGNMGSALAEKLTGLGCRIIVHDKYKLNFVPKNLTGKIEEVPLTEIFNDADIVSLHIPYLEENHYYVNKNWIDQFKKPIYLINTSRGKILKTADLNFALDNKIINGACLDVLEYETVSFENLEHAPDELKKLTLSDKVVLSPHIAGWSMESNKKMADAIFNKINSI